VTTTTADSHGAPSEHEFTRLTLTVTGGLAEVRLNRPERGNAADWATARDLLELSTLLAQNKSVRVVLLGANGPSFTAGGDINMFRDLAGPALPNGLRRMIDSYHLAVERFADLPVPIVAAVRGAAAGGGLGLVCAADIVIAAEDALFAMGSSAIGLSADGGASWYLPRLVGMRRAQELLLLNRRLSASEALDWGLVTRVVPTEEVDIQARAVAESLLQGATVAYGEIRGLLRDSMNSTLREQLSAERESVVRTAWTEDATEGIAAFTQHRRPIYQGR
jgi:2-(1,2-epoxy-1,2-dihydrophenyl)acetyl-CoA isomerase